MFWLKATEKRELDAAVRAVGKLATELIVTAAEPGHIFPATSMHFGGDPYFEKGDVWPTLEKDGRPYDFVCQVNLRECPVRPPVPFDLFTVFLCWAAWEEDIDPEMDHWCRVRTYRDASPEKSIHISRPAPRGLGDYRVRPCTVRTSTFMTYPWEMENFPEIVAAASKFWNPQAAYRASLKRLHFQHEFRSRVGGFPTWVHDNTLEYDDLILLAQIDYEVDANNCIGDSAPIYLAVSASNPMRIETDISQTF